LFVAISCDHSNNSMSLQPYYPSLENSIMAFHDHTLDVSFHQRNELSSTITMLESILRQIRSLYEVQKLRYDNNNVVGIVNPRKRDQMNRNIACCNNNKEIKGINATTKISMRVQVVVVMPTTTSDRNDNTWQSESVSVRVSTPLPPKHSLSFYIKPRHVIHDKLKIFTGTFRLHDVMCMVYEKPPPTTALNINNMEENYNNMIDWMNYITVFVLYNVGGISHIMALQQCDVNPIMNQTMMEWALTYYDHVYHLIILISRVMKEPGNEKVLITSAVLEALLFLKMTLCWNMSEIYA
jgi:hypothetical protein